MNLTNLITLDAVLPSLKVASKKQALQELSERASLLCDLPTREIFDALIQRERLGSTGIGNGIAPSQGACLRGSAVALAERDGKAPIDARCRRPLYGSGGRAEVLRGLTVACQHHARMP